MSPPISDQRCAHGGCNCATRPGEEYCSDYCKAAAAATGMAHSSSGGSCGCGHPECGGIHVSNGSP
jgi:hypothetical protein